MMTREQVELWARDLLSQLPKHHRDGVAVFLNHEAKLRTIIARFQTMSTVEMMCENLNVQHHVKEWEARCLKAESQIDALTAEIARVTSLAESQEFRAEQAEGKVRELEGVIQQIRAWFAAGCTVGAADPQVPTLQRNPDGSYTGNLHIRAGAGAGGGV